MLSSIYIVAIALAVKGAMAAHGQGYIGCLDKASYTPVANGAVIPDVADSATCAVQCGAQPTHPLYSYYNVADKGCTCSDTGFPTPTKGTATDQAGTCSTAQYSVEVTSTSWTFERCYQSISAKGDYTMSRSTGHAACFATCQSYPEMTYYTNGYCWCFSSGSSTLSQPLACNLGTTHFHYSHVAGSSASYGVRRRASQKRENPEFLIEAGAALPEDIYCPEGLSACATGEDSESYECIDTQWELESCGGCVNGLYGNFNVTAGADCTTVPGVGVGGSTCDRGSCQAYHCKDGWTLKGGECVR